MRVLLGLLVASLAVGCGPNERRGGGLADSPPPDACDGLSCRISQCEKMGMPPTTISGTVFAPNGTLALFGVTVYVPASDPGPLHDGAECSRCMDMLPGGSVSNVQSDEFGHFSLQNTPDGRNVPVVIQIGKWRKRFDVEDVKPCQDNPVSADLTSLPKNHLEGDMPRIAIATGGLDALECLVHKLGIDTAEFTSEQGGGYIQMYAGHDGGNSSLADTNGFTPAGSLWGSLDKLKKYDIAMFNCEGEQFPNEKPQAAMDNIKAYADFGGRVFLSHFHNIWISGETNNPTHAPAVWPQIARCDGQGGQAGNDAIDQLNNPKGSSFAHWMVNVGGSQTLGVIPIAEGRQTCTTLDLQKAERWVVFPNLGNVLPQNFQFTTPNEVAPDQRCGKVVFSDMHVASGSTSSPGTPFPNGCSTAPLTPQEKALAFMFFDISGCLGTQL